MKNFFKKLLIAASIACMGAAAIAGTVYAVEQYTDLQSFYRATLTSSISSTATSITVSSAPTVTTAFLVIEPRTPNQEIVRMTGRSGTTLTVVRGLSATSTSQADAGYKRSHAAGSSIEIVDVHFYVKELQIAKTSQFRGATTTAANLEGLTGTSTNDLAFVTNDERWYRVTGGVWTKQGDNSETIGGTKTFSSQPQIPTPTASTSAANMGYVDTKIPLTYLDTDATLAANSDVKIPSQKAAKAYADALAIAGAPVSNNVTTGILRTATSTQYSKGYSSTTPYAITSQFASSTASSTDSIVVATKASTGKIDPSFLNGSSESYTFAGVTTLASTTMNGTTTYGGFPLYGNFGDGSDSDLTVAGGATTTLTRDTYYNNLTVNGGLVTAGYSLFVKNNLAGTGNITWGTPTAGGVGGAGGNCNGGGGAAGGTSSGGKFVTAAGANGATGNAAVVASAANTSSIATTTGGAGGSASNTGGAAGAVSLGTKFGILSAPTMMGQDITTSGFVYLKSGSGGGGGSGGVANGGCGGGGGGGGGASGGVVPIYARNWGGSFQLVSVGGAGGAGGGAFSGDGGGGGGGGTGGTVFTVFENKTWTGTYNVAGGALGAGSAGSAGKNAGNNGVAGGMGAVYEINIRSLLR